MLDLLGRLHDAAVDTGRDGSVAEIRVLQALAYHGDHDLPRALAALERIQTDAPEPDSHLRLLLDEGPAMQALLRQAADDPAASITEPLRRLLDRVGARAASREPRHTLADPLSQRELEVLRLLVDSDLTGPDIARRLYVSLNTLRTHTKRIFTKLDVNNRAGAVRRAHQLGLV